MKNIKQTSVVYTMRHKADVADRLLARHRTTKAPVLPGLSKDKLRITPLGGQNGIGEKNMIVVEYGNDALILDCGFDLGIDLPGINYAIPATEYLASIRHKIRGYIISHGHLDHIGALIHVVPEYPAPIYGSRFTIGMVEQQFEKATERGVSFAPDTNILNMDSHETARLGVFTIELVRVTHAIPESSAIVVDTPIGRVINTGDFRLDPEPLDARPSDTVRLRQLGDEGVLLLMSESTNATQPGRTPTEHTLEESFCRIIDKAVGRVVVAVFSTNMNRVQMIINTAHATGRKVVLDGRSMLSTAELAVRLGNLKVPKGTLIPMREAMNLPDNKLVVICTGGQGEPGAALSRMAAGEHKFVALKSSDSVVISSTPIPGNEQSYQDIGNQLALIGVSQFRHPTHQLDGAGPLHVSGHGARDEHAEMIRLTRPSVMMPIYGGALHRMYHRQVALAEGVKDDHIVMVSNGEVTDIDKSGTYERAGAVTTGAQLVDATGATVPEIVTKDRLLLKGNGFMIVMVDIDGRGRLLSSPDIVTRGSIAVSDNLAVIDQLRREVRGCVARRRATSKTGLSVLKNEIRQAVADTLFARTAQTPTIIPVVNTIVHGKSASIAKPTADTC